MSDDDEDTYGYGFAGTAATSTPRIIPVAAFMHPSIQLARKEEEEAGTSSVEDYEDVEDVDGVSSAAYSEEISSLGDTLGGSTLDPHTRTSGYGVPSEITEDYQLPQLPWREAATYASPDNNEKDMLQILQVPTEETSQESPNKDDTYPYPLSSATTSMSNREEAEARRKSRRAMLYLVGLVIGPVLLGAIAVLVFLLIRMRQDNESGTSDPSWFIADGASSIVFPTSSPSIFQENTISATLKPVAASVRTFLPTDDPSPAPSPRQPPLTLIGLTTTGQPTILATQSPSKAPNPTSTPTVQPTPNPTAATAAPTAKPTVAPTAKPTVVASTRNPTVTPTRNPTPVPTPKLTALPIAQPTPAPTPNPRTPAPTTTASIDTSFPLSALPPFPDFRFVLWEEMTRDTNSLTQSAVMSGLGYNETTWNLPGSADIEAFSYGEILRRGPYLAFSLATLGFETPGPWNCWINHYWDLSWDELGLLPDSDTTAILNPSFGIQVRNAWATLGWTEASWSSTDESLWPSTESIFWNGLSATQKEAARIVCYTPELWDEIPIAGW